MVCDCSWHPRVLYSTVFIHFINSLWICRADTDLLKHLCIFVRYHQRILLLLLLLVIVVVFAFYLSFVCIVLNDLAHFISISICIACGNHLPSDRVWEKKACLITGRWIWTIAYTVIFLMHCTFVIYHLASFIVQYFELHMYECSGNSIILG